VITAVDSTVLLDIFGAHQTYGPASAGLLQRCNAEGKLIACDVVWAETAGMFDRFDEFLEVMKKLTVSFSAIEEKSALRASRMWRRYHQRGGRRQRVIADFLIAAHALEQADRLLTRDRGFYRGYFANLKVLDPSRR